MSVTITTSAPSSAMQKPFLLASIACHKFCPKEAVKAVLLVRDRGDKSLQQNRPLTKKGDAEVFEQDRCWVVEVVGKGVIPTTPVGFPGVHA